MENRDKERVQLALRYHWMKIEMAMEEAVAAADRLIEDVGASGVKILLAERHDDEHDDPLAELIKVRLARRGLGLR